MQIFEIYLYLYMVSSTLRYIVNSFFQKSWSCLTTQHQKYGICLYNKAIIPFALVVYELIYDSSSCYIIVIYIYII